MSGTNDFVIENGVLVSYRGSGGKVEIPEGTVGIGSKAFYGCKLLTAVTIPQSVVEIGSFAFRDCTRLINLEIPDSVTQIGAYAFQDCTALERVVLPKDYHCIWNALFMGCKTLREVALPERLTEIGQYDFEQDAPIVFLLTETLAARKEPLPQRLCRYQIKTTALGYAYLTLYQRMVSWQKWRFFRIPEDPAGEFDCMLTLLAENAFDKKTAKPVAEFISSHYKSLCVEKLEQMLQMYQNKKCAEIEELTQNRALQQYLGREIPQEDSREEDIRKLLERFGTKADAAAVVKKGIPWKDSKELCPREALIALLSCYIAQWERCAETVEGEISATQMLRDGTKVQIDPQADEIAALLNPRELSAFLTKLIKGSKYRPYLLCWARFAGEEDIASVTSGFKSLQRGKAKERYMAQNLEQALLISDTREAMQFYDRIECLDRYAKLRGKTAMELRDTEMMPDLGFDAQGCKYYDLGGTIVDVQVGADFTPTLFDRNKQKIIRSIPKKGVDAAAAEAAAKDFTEFKKELKKFIKLRSEQLCRMHITGEKVRGDLWQRIYREHPVICHLAACTVWMDEKNNTFTVMNGKILDSNLVPYIPQGSIQVAHVLSMDAQDVLAWQKTLVKIGQSQLFEQVWEPVLSWDAHSISDRCEGVVIASKDRNTLKTNLLRRGIRVHAGEMEREFDPYGWGYEFSDSNTLYLGSSMELSYRVDAQSGDLTLGKAKITAASNSREMNAILLELDKAAVLSRIAADQAEYLNHIVLDQFSPAHIRAFLSAAMTAGAVNCTAVLLDYQNNQYPEYNAMDVFVLDW